MLREAREAGHLATTAVLIITGQANPDNPDEFPVLRKPLDIDALVRQAQTILGAPGRAAESTTRSERRWSSSSTTRRRGRRR